MDWGTHMVLAAKLLESCRLDKGATIYSDLPAIDIEPAHYHRVYAHILENLPIILDVALEVLGFAEFAHSEQLADYIGKRKLEKEKDKDIDKWRYAYDRVTSESATFIRLAREASEQLGDDTISKMSTDKMSAGVSLISHIYFDTFNNPVQAFLPHSSQASAQWAFWDSIDYMRFREEFYNDGSIIAFRQEIAKRAVWNIKLSPPAMLKAMIIRIGEMAEPSIFYDVIDNAVRKFLRYMEIAQYQRADKELEFCHRLEDEIIGIIKRKFPKNAN